MKAPLPARDPGLQAERTALAWSRTALAILGNGLLALRYGWMSGRVPIMVLALALLLGAAIVHVEGLRRRHELLDAPQLTAPAGSINMVAAIALAACATGLASMLVT